MTLLFLKRYQIIKQHPITYYLNVTKFEFYF